MSSECVESVYGLMPSSLGFSKLGNLCVKGGVQTGPFGSQLHQEDYVEVGTPIITVEHLGENRIVHSNLPKVSDQDKHRLSKYSLKEGDIVFSRVGSVDRRALVQRNEEGWLFSGRCLRVRPDREVLDSEWLSYFFGLPSFKSYIRGIAVGATMPSLNTKILSDVPVYYPSIGVQREAASTLARLDDRITLLRENNTTLEAIAQALFKSWFVDFDPVRAKMDGRAPEGMDEATAALFPDSFEESELGLVPRGWRVGSLADLAEFQNGYAFKSKDWVDSGHPVVKIGDVKPGIIDFTGCSFVTSETTTGLDRFRLNRGDLLVGMTGYVGETGLAPEVEPAAYLNQRVGRIATASGMRDGGLVYCLVRNAAFKVYAEAQSHGSAQANVSGSALLNYSSVVPDADVQTEFNNLIYPILETILSNHEQAQTLATLRDTLLPRLISGQLRLPESVDKLDEALP